MEESRTYDEGESSLEISLAHSMTTNSMPVSQRLQPDGSCIQSTMHSTPAMKGVSTHDPAIREGIRPPSHFMPADFYSRDGNQSRITLMRDLALDAFQSGMPDMSSFCIDKAISMAYSCGGTIERADVLLMARAHKDSGDYLRAASVLTRHKMLHLRDRIAVEACVLASQCLLQAGKLEDCTVLLEEVMGSGEEVLETAKSTALNVDRLSGSGRPRKVNPMASLCALRGRAMAMKENTMAAVEWLTTALEIDARCMVALQCLVDWHLLPPNKQTSLLMRLNFEPGEEWLKELYMCQLDPWTDGLLENFEHLEKLGVGHCHDVLTARAAHAYAKDNPREALALCRASLESDPYALLALPVYLACMMELKMKPQLYHTAHRLVQTYPNRAISWHAVGCYYHLLGRDTLAQKHFLKATQLDPKCAVAWIGFGNAFSAKEESPQAVGAYRSAARLFTGSHLPMLYIGMEYLRTMNMTLAQDYIDEAVQLCPTDPLVRQYEEEKDAILPQFLICDVVEIADEVRNEAAVAAYLRNDYAAAAAGFEAVTEAVCLRPPKLLTRWSTAFSNLGHCYRKLLRWDDAISMFRKALSLDPSDAATHTALAFTLHLCGNLDEAVEIYHVSLSLCPDESLAAELLERALQDALCLHVQSVELDAPKVSAGSSLLSAH